MAAVRRVPLRTEFTTQLFLFSSFHHTVNLHDHKGMQLDEKLKITILIVLPL